MAKPTKKAPAVAAPVVDKSKEQEKAPAKIDVIQVGDIEKLGQAYAKNGGLDANRRVDMLTGLRIMFHDDPSVAKSLGLAEDVINKINGITALGYAAALIDEVQFGPSGWAAKMRVSQLEQLKAVAPLLGVEIDTKALPAPNKEGEIEVKSEAIKISKETKKQLEAEKKVQAEAENKDYLTDHTKIQTDEQLKEALGFQLVDGKISNPVDRLITTAQFYRSYLEARAEKSDNAEAELAKIHESTLLDLLQDITTMVPPTFALTGYGKYLCGLAAGKKNIVPAFNMLKRACTNKKTNKCTLTDNEIATLVRIIVVWNSSAQIAAISKSIEGHRKNIEILNKDAKANAKGIESENKSMQDDVNKIGYYQWVIGLTTDPSFEIADEFISAYNKEDHKLHVMATDLFDSIMRTYYEDVEIPELEMDTALLNVQQRVGIILNLFNDNLLKRTEYSEENLVELGKPEEKKEEEAPKNA
jgi:hypothetical protein